MTGGAVQERLSTIDLLAVKGIFPARENTQSVKDRYEYLCPLPGHSNDTDPSFSVHADRHRWHCFPCDQGGGPAKLLILLTGPDIPRPVRPPKVTARDRGNPSGCTLAQLAEARPPLTVEHLRGLGWWDTLWYGIPGIAIAYPDGSIRYRVGLEGRDRFRWAKGSKPGIYGLDQLESIRRAGQALFVEGETDVAAGRVLDLPVVGLPGVGTWKDEWWLQFQGCQIYAWQEPEQGGETFINKLSGSFPNLMVIEPPPGIKDLCELLDQAGDGALDLFNDLKAEARPYPDDALLKANVPNTVYIPENVYLVRDKAPRPTLWAEAKESFPSTGVKASTKATALYSEKDRKALVCNLMSHSWRNRENAQHKRRCFYFNVLPRMNGLPVYQRKVAFDDWNPNLHKALAKRINRAIARDDGSNWAWFDNALGRGYYLYLTNVPGLRGFEEVQDVKPVLVDALRSIRPPGREEPGRFRPYGGSDGWVANADTTGEEDQGRWEIIAQRDGEVDYTEVEIECIAEGIGYEMVPPYWRKEVGPGMELRVTDLAEAVNFFGRLGYTPTRRAASAVEGIDSGKIPDS